MCEMWALHTGLHRGKVFIRTFLGVDYERSHEDIARAAAAAVSGELVVS